MNVLRKKRSWLMSINHDLANTSLTKRQGLIVYLNSINSQFKLRRYGDIVYFSKKNGYCVLYVDQKEADKMINAIKQLDFVKDVQKSSDDEIDLSSKHIEEQITELAAEAEKKLLDEQEQNTDYLL